MKKLSILITVLSILIGLGTIHAQPIAFTNVTVIDVLEGVGKPGMTVVIAGERITHVGKSGAMDLPADARMIDASGKFLIPGLWDMHVHIFDQFNRRPRPAKTWYFPLFIANGVTGVRDMWTNPEDMKRVRDWRSAHQKGSLLAPRIAAVGTIVDGPAGAEERDISLLTLGPTVEVVRTPAEAPQFVRELKKAGIDFVKTYSNLGRETYFALAEAAKKHGMYVAGHIPFAVDVAEASSAGHRSLEHLFQILESSSSRSEELLQVSGRDWSSKHFRIALDTFDEQKFLKLVAVMVNNDTHQVPTLVMSNAFTYRDDPTLIQNDERLRYIPAAEIEAWKKTFAAEGPQLSDEVQIIGERYDQKRLEVLRRMQKGGVPFMAGSDVGNPFVFPGFSLHDELALLVAAGFTDAEALKTATSTPAEFLDLLDSLGTVEQGKLADLVLLNANPLEDIRNTQKIRAVVANGRYFDRQALDRMLKEVQKVVNE